MLTSSECLKALKDKGEKKRSVEEKQRQKEEREVKKKQKEEEMKYKSELKAQKAATREAKLQEKQFRQGKRGKGQAKRKSDNTVSSSRPAQKKARNDNADEEIDSERCCVCFGRFEDDAGTNPS